MSTADKKIILVIGATGAQGSAVVNALLAPGEDESPSPYAVRALTRDPDSRRAKELAARGVECVRGRFDDFPSVAAALKGAYGAYVNTDGYTVGSEKEVWSAVCIFELAKQAGLLHFVWSALDYGFKLTNYNPRYRCESRDGKGVVSDFLKAQASVVSDNTLSWTVVTTCPYMDMLYNMMFGPMKKRDDGTYVFATPVGSGHVPMVALSDLGFFARYVFDNRESTSGVDVKIGSDWVSWDYLKATFEKVTGYKAEVIYQTMDEWWGNMLGIDKPLANERKPEEGTVTVRENFTAWWALWRDDIITRDWEWIRRVNPKGHTLESWMRAEDYKNRIWSKRFLLKNAEEGKAMYAPNWERIAEL